MMCPDESDLLQLLLFGFADRREIRDLLHVATVSGEPDPARNMLLLIAISCYTRSGTGAYETTHCCSRSLDDLFGDGFRERAILQEGITVYTQAHRSK
jgi:hypothetical protein